MSHTHTRIYIHIVIAVKPRLEDFKSEKRDELQKFMTEILRKKGHNILAIRCLPDHSHLLTEIQPEITLDGLVREIKNSSTRFINRKKWFPVKFQWQQGVGLFSCSHSQVQLVAGYIQNQDNYHLTKHFRDEYREILTKLNIPPEEKHLFAPVKG